MKFYWVCSCIALQVAALFAAEELDEPVPDFSEFSYWDCHPVHVGADLIRVGQASIDGHGHSDASGHLYFRKTNAFIYGFLPVTKDHILSPRVDWTTFTLDWNQNPAFNTTHFYYMRFALSYYTTALENWRWVMRADYSLDTEHFAHPGSYGLFSGLVWGTSQLFQDWHYHVGVLFYKGLAASPVYPVIGLDYSPNAHWLLQAVFPILYSVQYHITPSWTIAVKGRPLKERCRVGASQPQPRAVFNYSTMGAELNLHFEKFLRCEFEAYIGYNFGGDFYIKHPGALYTNVGGAPYAGFSFDFGF